jgi:hypothetical protein
VIKFVSDLLSEDMKKTQKQTKAKHVERHAGGLSKLKYT